MPVETAMQYSLTQEQLDFLEVIRQMVVEKVTPRAAEIDATGEFPQDIRELFAGHDIFGLPFEEEHGGTGTGEIMLVAAIEEIGWPSRILLRCRSSSSDRTS